MPEPGTYVVEQNSAGSTAPSVTLRSTVTSSYDGARAATHSQHTPQQAAPPNRENRTAPDGNSNGKGGKGKGGKRKGGAIKIEPKTYFANERTLLQWVSASVLLMTAVLALLNLEQDDSKFTHAGDVASSLRGAKLAGVCLCPVPIGFMLYALSTYVRRMRAMKDKDLEFGWNDLMGPLVLVTILGVLIVLTILTSIIWPRDANDLTISSKMAMDAMPKTDYFEWRVFCPDNSWFVETLLNPQQIEMPYFRNEKTEFQLFIVSKEVQLLLNKESAEKNPAKYRLLLHDSFAANQSHITEYQLGKKKAVLAALAQQKISDVGLRERLVQISDSNSAYRITVRTQQRAHENVVLEIQDIDTVQLEMSQIPPLSGARSVAVRGTSRPAVDNFVRQRFTAGEFLLPAACVGATWADFVRNYMDAWVIEAFNKRPQAGR